MPSPRVRLAFSKVLWRATVVLFFALELSAWGFFRRLARPKRAFAALMFQTPALLFAAFLIAAILTIAADLIVRLVVRPLVLRWNAPTSEETAGSFHLDARETVHASVPARRSAGWLWPTGRLIVTDRRVWFFPDAWDAEPWSRPIERCRSAEVVATQPMLLGLIEDLPERLRIEPDDAEPELFALSRPDEALMALRAASRPRVTA